MELIDMSGKVSLHDVALKVNELVEAYNSLSQMRNRGPKSEKVMTDDDARRVISGDLKDVSFKAAAAELGLSYGQVYSARKGFTFKKVHKEVRDTQPQE